MSSDVSRLMVEIAVRQALKNRSKQSFRRSLRTLVEYGEHYSKGPFQSNFFLVVQQMLRDENHPYYLLAERAWAQVDSRYLQHFCLNMGYESWTRGAATIRALESELGCNIPWILTIVRSRPTGPVLSEEAIRALMTQGMAMGIYAYLLVDCQLDTALVRRLSTDYSTCALTVMALDSKLTEDALNALEGTDNVALFAVQDSEAFTSTPLLLAHKRLYGLCTFYSTAEDAEAICSGKALACDDDTTCMLRVFMPKQGCPADIRNKVDEALCRFKQRPVTAQFPIELSRDFRRIDQIISTDDCALAVDADGAFFLPDPDTATGLSVYEHSLAEVIRACLKK